MTTFITTARYTAEAVRGMLARPEDRAEALSALLKAGGMRLVSYYVTMGETDVLVISEGDGPAESFMPTLMAAAAGGGVTDLKTVVAVSSAEAKGQFATAAKMAAGFKSVGQG
jgi:uncharacterized protein with GYD domain